MTTVTATSPKYPLIHVYLLDSKMNAYTILSRCLATARRAGLDPEELMAFRAEATSGDVDALLRTCNGWFDVD